MARPKKIGFDDFPVSVDMFANHGNRKIRLLISRYGADGIALYMYLLCEIYRQGYYMKTDTDTYILAEIETGVECGRITEMVDYMCEKDIFDSNLYYNYGVLTSYDIQIQFQNMIKSRASRDLIEVCKEFWLINDDETKNFITFANSLQQENNCKPVANDDLQTVCSEKTVANTPKTDSLQQKSNCKPDENPENSKKKKSDTKEKEVLTEIINNNSSSSSNNNNIINNTAVAAAVKCYEDNIGVITTIIAEKIINWLESVDVSLIEYAIEQAAINNKRQWNYIEAIIRSHFNAGRLTRQAAEQARKPRAGGESEGLYDHEALEKRAWERLEAEE